MVVVYHSSFYAKEHRALFSGLERLVFTGIGYLWLGVPIFFVISGYCISATCDSSRRKQHSVREYLWRRYRRIFPPFWIIVAISTVVVAAAGVLVPWRLFDDGVHPIAHPGSLSFTQWLGNLSLTESWRSLVAGAPQQYFLGHAWSLCYEEQFYIICGILLFAAPSKFFRNALFVSIGVVAFAPIAMLAGIRVEGFFFDGRWLMFGFGILVYWTINYARTTVASTVRKCGALAVLGTLGAVGFRPTRIFLLSGVGIEIVAGILFAVALLYLRPFDSRIVGSRVLSPVTWCGSMCYSLYLAHWTLVKPLSNWLWRNGMDTPRSTLLITIPACLLISVALGRLFYILVERRFLNTRVEVRAVAARA